MMNSRTRNSPAARPGLVALLRAEVVPELRQLLVRLQLACVERHRLLVRERQDERRPTRSLSLKTSGIAILPLELPQLRRSQHRPEHLLLADRIHLLADDLHDLLLDAPAERQERPQAGADLADEAAAHEQLVARRLGVSRRLAQRRKKQL